MDKINKFDLSKYNLRGEELLASATVTGLYAMQADGADCPHCDFGSLVEGVEGKQVTINAPAAKEIIRFIYERFVEGDTYSAISKQLEEKGARRLRSDKPFSASAIIRFTDTFSAPSAGPLSKGVRSRIPVAITRHGTAPRGRRGRTGTAAGTWSGKRRSSPMRSVDSLDGMPLTRSGSRKQA